MASKKIVRSLVLFFIIEAIIWTYFQQSNEANVSVEIKSTNDSKMEKAIIEREESYRNEKLEKQMRELLIASFSEDELERVSFSLSIPEYAYEFSHNEKLLLANASTIKLPLNMYIYELALEEPTILAEELMYTVEFFEDGAGVMQAVEPGTTFTVQTLLTNSIRYSDNIATNMLFERFIDDLNSCVELIPYFGAANYQDWTSASENKMIALNYLYTHQKKFQTLINDMKIAKPRNRIPKYIPNTIDIAIKTGDIDATIHDYAILFDSKNIDYLISLSMIEISDANERMAEFSREIYFIIQKNKL